MLQLHIHHVVQWPVSNYQPIVSDEDDGPVAKRPKQLWSEATNEWIDPKQATRSHPVQREADAIAGVVLSSLALRA